MLSPDNRKVSAAGRAQGATHRLFGFKVQTPPRVLIVFFFFSLPYAENEEKIRDSSRKKNIALINEWHRVITYGRLYYSAKLCRKVKGIDPLLIAETTADDNYSKTSDLDSHL